MGIKLYFKNYRTKGFLVGFGLAVLWIMAGFLVMVVPQAAIAAEPAALTVTGDGVDKTVSFTMAELNALPQKTLFRV